MHLEAPSGCELNDFQAQDHLVRLVHEALAEAKIGPKDLSCIAFTKVRLLQPRADRETLVSFSLASNWQGIAAWSGFNTAFVRWGEILP